MTKKITKGRFRVQREVTLSMPEQRRRETRAKGIGRTWITESRCYSIATAEKLMLRLRADGHDLVRIAR